MESVQACCYRLIGWIEEKQRREAAYLAWRASKGLSTWTDRQYQMDQWRYPELIGVLEWLADREDAQGPRK